MQTGHSMSEWQPIDTAPADSREVLLLSQIGKVYVAYRGGFAGNWLTTPGQWTVNRPTHWMPLPSTPDTPGAKHED